MEQLLVWNRVGKDNGGEDEGDGSCHLKSYLHLLPHPLTPSTPALPQQRMPSHLRRPLLFTASGSNDFFRWDVVLESVISFGPSTAR